jgi:hypothetical protein
MADDLTDLEFQVLAFERRWWKHPGAKDQAIKDLFDLSATRYYQVVNDLLDRPEAQRHDPQLINRLRRLREHRQGSRSARRLASP